MPEGAANQPKEFLVVTLPDDAKAGASLRLLAIGKTLNDADSQVEKLDPSALGRVAILERRKLYVRRPAVESVELTDPISK